MQVILTSSMSPRALVTGASSGRHQLAPNDGLLSFLPQGHVGTTATKKIDVYLSMQATQEKLHPMTVVTMANARVHELIGLICWQYTSEGREPKLT